MLEPKCFLRLLYLVVENKFRVKTKVIILSLILNMANAMMPPSRARAPRLPPCKIIVINTNDAGPYSLRNAVEKIYKYPKHVCGITFNVAESDNPVITLNSDIIIEDEVVDQMGQCIIDTEDKNSLVTIQGIGSLIIKSLNVKVAENIVRIVQPKSLVQLATQAVYVLAISKQIKKKDCRCYR